MKIKRREPLHKLSIFKKVLALFGIIFYFISLMLLNNCFTIFENNMKYCDEDRFKEKLDRGIIALYNNNDEVYIGWRLLEDDPPEIAFNVYRDSLEKDPVKLNTIPIKLTTNFVDRPPSNESSFRYWICPVVNGKELSPSKTTSIANNPGEPFVSIKLNDDYTFQKVGIADLNGDGSYDFVIKQPNVNVDPFGPPLGNWRRSEGTYNIEAYLSDGTFLWCNDLGWDIEQGIWYSPYLVYDFDGNGKAEVAVKTGEGDHRDLFGRVTSGNEYLSIWDGMFGMEITRVAWPERGQQMYNWYSRNQLGVAYLDGCHPSILVARGTYGLMKLEAYKYDGNNLESIWRWENAQECGFKFYGQGAHFMHSADVDSDAYDEVILGSCVVDDCGIGLWSTGLQHADFCYVGDINPKRPGLEIYYGIEGVVDFFPEYDNGMCMVDAATGKILWGLEETTYHVHEQGLVSDIDASHPGMECYGGEADVPKRWLYAANGELIANESTFDVGLAPKAVYWDADLQRELLNESRIYDFDTNKIYLDGIKGYQVAWADILGDWREEIITSVEGELRIYTTTIPARDRRVCLMVDPIYRLDVAHLSMGYAQVPMTSYCLDEKISY